MTGQTTDSERALDGIVLRARGHVRQIVLNEPERRNPMSPAVMNGLHKACDIVEADDHVRAVIVTGAGTAFCAGGDLPYNDEHLRGPVERQHEFLTRLYRPFLRVLDLPVPTIAAINGAAVGGGLAFAMLCDVRIAADNAKLVTAFAELGFAPGMGLTYTLERHVGLAMAAELLYTGRILTGAEAAEIGLVNRAVPGERLANEAWQLAGQIADNSPVVNRLVKASLFTGYRTELRQRLERDILAQVMTSVGEDYRARRDAKREARRKLAVEPENDLNQLAEARNVLRALRARTDSPAVAMALRHAIYYCHLAGAFLGEEGLEPEVDSDLANVAAGQ